MRSGGRGGYRRQAALVAAVGREASAAGISASAAGRDTRWPYGASQGRTCPGHCGHWRTCRQCRAACLQQPTFQQSCVTDTVGRIAPNPENCRRNPRSEEHTSELQSLMRISYAVFCLKTKQLANRNTQAKNQKPKLK